MKLSHNTFSSSSSSNNYNNYNNYNNNWVIGIYLTSMFNLCQVSDVKEQTQLLAQEASAKQKFKKGTGKTKIYFHGFIKQ